MDKNAIVVVYKRDYPSTDCIRTVGEAVMRHTHSAPETVEVYALDEKEIANALVAKVIGTEHRVFNPEYTTEEAAVIYLRTVEPSHSNQEFMSTISSKYVLAIMQGDLKNKIVTSVQALAKGSWSNISSKVCQAYGYTPSKHKVINEIYSVCAGHTVG